MAETVVAALVHTTPIVGQPDAEGSSMELSPTIAEIFVMGVAAVVIGIALFNVIHAVIDRFVNAGRSD
jgi:hypothetical protein